MKGPSTISQGLWMGAINNSRDIIDGRAIYNPYGLLYIGWIL
jgi:hypothetical protein